jgi:hypothetical protein
MMHDLLQSMGRHLADFGEGAASFGVRLLTALLIALIGWVCAGLLRTLTRKALGWLHFNALLEKAGATELLGKTPATAPDRAVGSVVFWLVWLAVLLSAVRTLGLVEAGALVGDLARYLPKLASAIVIVVVGVFLSNLAWRAALVAAVDARLPAAKVVGGLVRGLTLVATVAMALEQLEVGQNLILAVFTVSFGGVMLAAAIAFGLGGRHLARQYLEHKFQARRSESTKSKEPSHL